MATASGGGLVKEFLRLGLRLGRHVDSMVDAYYGPPELAETRAAKPVVPPERLVVEARRSSNGLFGFQRGVMDPSSDQSGLPA